jgi:putative ABC transport system permease protein
MALISDFRAAFRALAAHRTFTVIAVLTLAAGFALAASILTVVNAYVVRALPYPEADRLYRVDYAPAGQPWPRGMEQLDWSSLDDVLELTIAWDLDVFYLLGRRYPESAPGAWVSPGYLSGLGIRAALGRALTTDDFRPGTPPVAMISHRLWQSRFAADPDIVGQTFDAYVSDRPEEPESFTIVGVLPSNLWHLNVYTEVLTPLKAPSFPYQVRLRPGVSSSVAVDRIDTFIRNSLSALPPHYRVSLTSVHESYVTQIRPVLWSVVAGTVLVLLIAAANVAVLMIVRARKRERELAIRLALGAGRMRVARLVALEGALVAASSMVLGLITARIVIPSFAPVLERSLDRCICSRGDGGMRYRCHVGACSDSRRDDVARARRDDCRRVGTWCHRTRRGTCAGCFDRRGDCRVLDAARRRCLDDGVRTPDVGRGFRCRGGSGCHRGTGRAPAIVPRRV